MCNLFEILLAGGPNNKILNENKSRNNFFETKYRIIRLDASHDTNVGQFPENLEKSRRRERKRFSSANLINMIFLVANF